MGQSLEGQGVSAWVIPVGMSCPLVCNLPWVLDSVRPVGHQGFLDPRRCGKILFLSEALQRVLGVRRRHELPGSQRPGSRDSTCYRRKQTTFNECTCSHRKLPIWWNYKLCALCLLRYICPPPSKCGQNPKEPARPGTVALVRARRIRDSMLSEDSRRL